MKIRHGFVSNSSSSSFVMYGVSIDKPDWYYDDKGKDFKNDLEDEGFRWVREEDKLFVGNMLFSDLDYGPQLKTIPNDIFRLGLTSILSEYDIVIDGHDFGVIAGTAED